MSRYIDADKAIKECKSLRETYLIDSQPTADVRENVKACWQIGQSKKPPWRSGMICSNCGFEVCSADKGWNVYINDNYHYCPNCGADMRGEA